MLCDLITNIPITIAYIYLLRQAGDIAGIFSPNQSWEQMTFTLSMITLSVGLFIYIAIITKDVLKQMQEMQAAKEGQAKDVGIEVTPSHQIQEIDIKITEDEGDNIEIIIKPSDILSQTS